MEILPPISTSDHFVIRLSLALNSSRQVRADFDLARALILSTNWDFLILMMSNPHGITGG